MVTDNAGPMESLTLGKREIPYIARMIKHEELVFYPENPRIYQIVYSDDDEPTQEKIQEVLGKQDYVRRLTQAIEANGGLIDPLWVRDGDNTVFEGNSRLAAYRLLARRDAIRWAKIKCRVLPKDITGDDIFSLLSQYHVIGRKDWSPYEQAGMFWRRTQSPSVTAETISSELGLTYNFVSHIINVYTFMDLYNDRDPIRWSFYDQYLKSRKIAKSRADIPQLDEIVVRKINSGEIPRAEDVRDKLTKICGVGGRVQQEFVTKEGSFDKCFEKAIMQTENDALYQALNKFRTKIGDLDTKKEIQRMTPGRLRKCRYELQKIRAAATRLLKL
ncbi:hypothetical protein ACFLUD_01060 [Chloroflexota bacterium]